MLGTKIAAVFIMLAGYLAPVQALAQGTSQKPARPPAQANTQNLGGAKIQTLQLTPQGGRLQFMHGGKLVTGDMSNAKVFRMVNGRQVEVPRAQWQAALSAAKASGTPLTVITPKSRPQGLVVIAIIAILIGLLLPAVQKAQPQD